MYKEKMVSRFFFVELLLLCANFTSQHAWTKKKLLKLYKCENKGGVEKKNALKNAVKEEWEREKLQCAKATKRTLTSTLQF